MHRRPETNPRLDFLSGGGELGALIRAHDWAATPLGPADGWPSGLKTLVGVMLGSHQPMFIAWGTERTLLYNDAYAEILVRKHPTALGHDFLDVWQEIRADLQPIVEQAYGGTPVHMDDITLMMERRGYHEETHFSFSYTPVRDENGAVAGFFCPCTELTGQIMAEQRLATETGRQRRLFEQAPGFITVLHGPEHRFEFVNQAYTRLFGERNFIGKTIREAFPELGGQGYYKWLDQAYATGERFVASHVPARLQASPSAPARDVFLDFIYEPVRDEAGRITGIFCEGYDVTEAYLGRAVIEASNARYTSVLDAMSEGFIVLDEEYRITEVNAEGLRLDGRPARELIGKTNWEVAPTSVGTPVEAAYRRAMTERVPVELDHRYVDPSTGHDHWLALRIYPVPGGVAAFYRDISETKRAEEALRQSEAEARRWAALLEQLIETAPDPICTKDENGRFVLANSAAAEVIGRPREELAGLRNQDLLPADLAAFYDAEEERILKHGEALNVEECVSDRTRREGRTFLSTKVPLRAPHGPIIGLLGMARDITERQEVEAQLRESSERVQLALDAGAIVGTWMWDVPGDRFTADGRFARSFGLDPDLCRKGLPLKQVTDSIHEDDRPRVADAIAEALGRGGPYRCEYRVRHQDGVFRWIEANGRIELDEDGTPLRFPGVLIDIEDRRAAEAERDRATTLLHTFIEAVPGVVYAKDWGGRMLMANRGTTDLIGKPPEEYLGKTDAEFLRDRVQGEAIMANDRRIMDAGVVQQVEETVRRPDGMLATWLSTKAPLRNEAGEVIGLIGTSVDITDRKRIEAALKESQDNLRRLNETLEQRVADTTAARDRIWQNSRDLLAIVGADGIFRTVSPAWERSLGYAPEEMVGCPVSDFILPDDIGITQGIRVRSRHHRGEAAPGRTRAGAGGAAAKPEAGEHGPAHRRRGARLQQPADADHRRPRHAPAPGPTSGRRGSSRGRSSRRSGPRRWCNGCWPSPRRQPLQPTAVDLPQLVEGMAELVASTSGPRVKLMVDVNPSLPLVKADPNQLEMAILNLAVNARDAMPDGGQLTIAAKDEILGSRHRSKLPSGRYVRLSVADTGIGMDEATLTRAIEPFFSTKGIGKGTGLGLSMVHGLAAQLGGALTIRSKPGVGTSVELWLPIAVMTERRPEGMEEKVSLTAAGTALLVDEDIVRASTADMLLDLGYAVVETSSAEQALALIEGGLLPDVVVTDHLMPGMTGTDLARILEERWPALPILIISGYAEAEGISSDLPRLAKPFRQGELSASLSTLTKASIDGPRG